MFIKVPVYFDVQGSITELGLIQEFLSGLVEDLIVGDRKVSKEVPLTVKMKNDLGVPKEMKVFAIRRTQVLDGLR
jgi:hypothetical protein